jgi:SAM-dependent methyltransferase
VSEHERFLRAFHDARPGNTARALERAGSYDRLAARCAGRVLDLACGDGPLLARVPGAVGIDLSAGEVAAARKRGCEAVEGRAQALPFPDGSFDTVACHLAFMLFDEIERVVAELHRVLAPGGRFVAVLGGGPTAEGRDAFHEFLERLPKGGRRFGDPRAKSEAGWRQLFAGWSEPVFERWELDLSGSFDEVWRFLGASYELSAGDAEQIRDELARRYEGTVPCRVVTFYAEVTR